MKPISALSQAVMSRFGRNNHPSAPTVKPLKPGHPGADDTLWQKLHRSKLIRVAHPPVMLGVTVIALTGIVGYRFYNQPQLSVGTRSPSTISAPMDGEFLDEKTTEEKRKEIRTGTVPRLQRDPELTAQLRQAGQDYLNQINLLRELTSPFPFLSTKDFSLEVQQQLRLLSDSDWQQLQRQLTQPSPPRVVSPQLVKIQQIFAPKIANATSPDQVQAWFQSIEKARQRYQSVVEELPMMAPDNLSTDTVIAALQLDSSTWQTTQTTILKTYDRILTQGLPAGISQPLLNETIQLHLKGALPPEAKPIAQKILMNLLGDRHNLTIDKEATKRMAEQAASALETIKVSVQKGDVIVQAGETINQQQFVLLDGFGLSQRQINWEGLLRTAGLVSGALVIFCAISRRVHRPLRRRDHILLCLLSISAPALSLLDPYYANLPAIGVLTSSFYGPTLAVTQVLLVGGLSAFAVETVTWEYFLAGLSAALLAGVMAGRLRSRDDLAVLGGGIGLMQGGVYFAGYLILSASATTIWYAVLPGAIVYGLLGLAWAVVAIGVSPYLERIFDVVTPIRLVELSNPNCPLLQRLAKEAPGTFQHTLFVACLAESAARELRCNVELVRTGTLYHDIGKMHDPLGFIENQMGGPNKHDQIADPYVSVDIIKKHVSEGLVMARRYNLPQVVRDFIPEHQGQMLISYFYLQAKEAAEAAGLQPIDEAEFRYAGPIPQSRETGIVMLADSSEAALRSLKDTNPEVAMGMINRIFKARWRDNQLKDSGLKYEELPIIAEVFVRVWQQFHHQRIAYPKAALDPLPSPCPRPQPATES
ncbi:MAG: HD family phosphohydrolase [Synechocystis sp.]|nr:HD family phosphohydrolase [Synechocystis sp.]